MSATRIAGVVAIVLAIAACADDESDATPNALTIAATDYAFEVDGTAVAGELAISFSNNGAELHEVAMARLTPGTTIDDVRSAMATMDPASEEDPLAGLLEEDTPLDDLGMVLLPGSSLQLTGSGIEAGDYALVCFIPDAEGTSHATLGMLQGLTIGEGAGTAPQKADATFTATADGLSGPATVPAGERTLAVVNQTSSAREFSLVKLSEGKTFDDMLAWFGAAVEGPPDPASAPLDYLAFVFDAVQSRSATVTLTPGQWGIQVADPDNPSELPPDQDPSTVLFTVP